MHQSRHGHTNTRNFAFTSLASASDYSLSATTITINETGASTITLIGIPDEILEGDETIIIEVTNPPSGDYPGVTFPEPVTITIDDAEGTYYVYIGEFPSHV